MARPRRTISPETQKSGIDEDDLKLHFIGYFRKSIIASGLLENNVCMDGNYYNYEKEVYEKIKRDSNDPEGKVIRPDMMPTVYS